MFLMGMIIDDELKPRFPPFDAQISLADSRVAITTTPFIKKRTLEFLLDPVDSL